MESDAIAAVQSSIDAMLEHYRGHDRWSRRLMAYWSELVSTNSGAADVIPGSPLDQHLRLGGGFSEHLEVPRLAWRALAIAGEHMGYAEFLSFASRGGVNGTAELTLGRTIMLGAARALFLLEPEDTNDRQIRAARLANQEAHDAQQLLKRSAEVPELNGMHAALAEHTQRLREGAAEILTAAERAKDSRISETSLLDHVLPHLDDGLQDARIAGLNYWSQASGTAHARSWVWALRSTPYEDPAVTAAAIWSLPTALAGKAWELWNTRRGSSSPPAFPPDTWAPDPRRYLPPNEHGP